MSETEIDILFYINKTRKTNHAPRIHYEPLSLTKRGLQLSSVSHNQEKGQGAQSLNGAL